MINLKAKLVPVLTSLLGILAVAASFLWGALQREKKQAVAQELEDEKAAREQANAATEALIRGTQDEQDNSNPRNHKFGD